MSEVVCDRCKKKYSGDKVIDEFFYPASKFFIIKDSNELIAICNICLYFYYFSFKNNKDETIVEIDLEKYLSYQMLK